MYLRMDCAFSLLCCSISAWAMWTLCSTQYFLFCVEMSRQLSAELSRQPSAELAWLVRPALSVQDQFQLLQPAVDVTATCIALITTSVTAEVTVVKSLFIWKSEHQGQMKEGQKERGKHSCTMVPHHHQPSFISQLLIEYVKHLATLAGLYKDEKYLWVSPPSSKHKSPSNKKTN